MDTDFVTTEELAKILHVSRRTLDNYLAAGYLPPHLQIGRRLLWPRNALEKWFSEQYAVACEKRAL